LTSPIVDVNLSGKSRSGTGDPARVLHSPATLVLEQIFRIERRDAQQHLPAKRQHGVAPPPPHKARVDSIIYAL
jgi:hypothetical protein